MTTVDARAQQDDEHVAALLREVARDFVQREESDEDVAGQEADPARQVAELWPRMAQMGWSGLLIPTDLGGAERGLTEMAVVVDEVARVGLLSPLLPTAVEAASLLLAAGDESQQAAWLPRIADGSAIVSPALWEPGGDLDVTALSAEAVRGGDGTYRLSGRKLPVPYAGHAGALICAARVADEDAPALFLVDPAAPGVRRQALHTSNRDPVDEVVLEGVAVPTGDRLAASRPVAESVADVLDRGAVLASVQLLSMGRRALDLTVRYVSQRRQFDRLLGSFQAVQHHCADMHRDVEATRVVVEQALRRCEAGPARWEVSVAKAKASRSMMRVVELAHQLHGGVGFYTDYPLERFTRRVIAAQGVYGSAQWHRRRLVRLLRDDPTRFRRDAS